MVRRRRGPGRPSRCDDAPAHARRARVLAGAAAVSPERAMRDLGAAPDATTEPPSRPTSDEAVAAPEQLSSALGLPELLAGLPRSVDAVTFLPDDVLHGFPFAAVRWDGRWL